MMGKVLLLVLVLCAVAVRERPVVRPEYAGENAARLSCRTPEGTLLSGATWVRIISGQVVLTGRALEGGRLSFPWPGFLHIANLSTADEGFYKCCLGESCSMEHPLHGKPTYFRFLLNIPSYS